MNNKRKVYQSTNTPEEYPLVTIITAVYNSKSSIAHTIDSVLSQDYPNIEYIVLDGGSSDGTQVIIDRYKERIDYFYSEPDNGIYDAFNKGIALAHGEWIYFLGADDKFANDHVLKDVFSKKHASKMVYGNVILSNTSTIYDGKFKKTKLYYRNICQQAIFYHKDIFQVLGKFDLKYKTLADWVLNMRIFASKGTNPVYSDKIIAIYCTEGKSSISTDHYFSERRPCLIKEIFGNWHYIYFKYVYWIHLKLNAYRLNMAKQKTKT